MLRKNTLGKTGNIVERDYAKKSAVIFERTEKTKIACFYFTYNTE